jgi:DNA-directed RNA polymerase subunit F/uncharacterized protein YejL (UPF0352 family)
MDIQNNEPTVVPITKPEQQLMKQKETMFSLKTLLIAIPLLLVTFTVAGFLALNQIAKESLPGSQLYTFKTKVAEEVLERTKMSTEAKLAYEQRRFESRLNDFITLNGDSSTSSHEVTSNVAWLAEKHANAIIDTVTSNSDIRTVKKVEMLSGLATHARAMEILTDDSKEFKTIADQVSQVEGKVSDSLSTEIEKFVTEDDEVAIGEFFSAQIQYVATNAQSLAFGSTAQNLVLKRVADAQDAVVSKNMTEALTYILRAREAILIDGYLQDGERAPENGILPEPQAMPEGS